MEKHSLVMAGSFQDTVIFPEEIRNTEECRVGFTGYAILRKVKSLELQELESTDDQVNINSTIVLDRA